MVTLKGVGSALGLKKAEMHSAMECKPLHSGGCWLAEHWLYNGFGMLSLT